MIESNSVFCGIDAGGTTFKCGVMNGDNELIQTCRVPVTTPEETLDGCLAFFRSATAEQHVSSFGIASFGPIDVDLNSSRYGTILETPKPGWANTDLRSFFLQELNWEPVIDTDVNGALLAEMKRGAAIGVKSAAYITVGAGIGAGVFTNSEFVGKPAHPEFGHIPVMRHPDDMSFGGVCPFHKDCLEGLASVTAMRARWGSPEDLPPDHSGWPIIAFYLAQACRVLTLTLRVERIILGGGLMLAPQLLGLIRGAYDEQMAGYLGSGSPSGADLIYRAGLGDDAGLIGAITLGRMRGQNG